MSESLPAAERLLNLVIALVNTTGKMTKEQIRTSVAGLRPRPEHRGLRAHVRAGQGDAAGARGPRRHRDRPGPRRRAGLPGGPRRLRAPPMQLSAAQLGILALAAEFWSDQVLQVDASRALTKLRVVGARPPEGDASSGSRRGSTPRAPPSDRCSTPPRRVRRCASPTGRRARARCATASWSRGACSRRRGGWYLVGLDRDRAAPRVFRLSRIVGSVRDGRGGRCLHRAPEADPRAMLDSAQEAEARTAWLAVQPERAEALRARARPRPGPPRRSRGLGRRGSAVHPRPATWPTRSPRTPTRFWCSDPASLRESVLRRLRDAVAMGERLGATRG